MLAAWPSPPPARLPRSSGAPPRCFHWPPGWSPWAWRCSSHCGRWGWGWSPWPWPGSPSRARGSGCAAAGWRAWPGWAPPSSRWSRPGCCSPSCGRSWTSWSSPGRRPSRWDRDAWPARRSCRARPVSPDPRWSGRCPRGIEAVVMQAGDDLAALADAAVAGRPQSIGMAGGDGSMAVVAARAAAHDIAFVCVPSGTRNHLALDLGVDRDDPVGALDAFTDGIERRVDLAEVNGRVFVNNVSLGVYARVVQADSYRADKVGTTLELLPDLIGPEAAPFELRYVDPSGRRHDDARLVLVSNNRYLTRRLTALGSRPRLDAGRLGVIVARVDGRIDALRLAGLEAAGSVDRHGGWDDWEAETFEVDAPGAIEAGVDGEAVVLEPPVHFRSRAGALPVRISRGHPGVSPAAVEDALVARQSVGALLAVAAGREIAPRASPPTPTGYPPTPLSASVTPIRSPRR